MKKKYNLLLSLAVVSLFCYSCSLLRNCVEGEGDIIERELSLDDFSSINLSGSSKVILKQGATQKVTIKAQKNIIALLDQEVSGKEWAISFSRCVKPQRTIEIFIQIPTIDELEVNGSGSIESVGKINSDKLKLDIQGSGALIIELDAKELESEIAGSGDIKLKGTTKIHEIEINGSGDVEAYDLKSDEAEVEINGSGDVKIDVSYSLNVEVNGSGDVYYKGDVKEIKSSINGSGNLKQAE